MPEIMPGGLVAIGDRIQMFVEGVTHSFDMAGGFSTSAELVAPAALKKDYYVGLPLAAKGDLTALGESGGTSSVARRDRLQAGRIVDV